MRRLGVDSYENSLRRACYSKHSSPHKSLSFDGFRTSLKRLQIFHFTHIGYIQRNFNFLIIFSGYNLFFMINRGLWNLKNGFSNWLFAFKRIVYFTLFTFQWAFPLAILICIYYFFLIKIQKWNHSWIRIIKNNVLFRQYYRS